jgi:hypothetical protein
MVHLHMCRQLLVVVLQLCLALLLLLPSQHPEVLAAFSEA